MDPWQTARAHAAGRTAIGAALIVFPRLVGGAWVGADARRTSIEVYSAALGVRDAALGAGLLQAARASHGARPWIAAGIAADTVDLLATLRRRDELPAFGVASVALMAGGSALLGAWLHRELD